jgi:hypothetical protein
MLNRFLQGKQDEKRGPRAKRCVLLRELRVCCTGCVLAGQQPLRLLTVSPLCPATLLNTPTHPSPPPLSPRVHARMHAGPTSPPSALT